MGKEWDLWDKREPGIWLAFPGSLQLWQQFGGPLRPTAAGLQLVLVIVNLQCSRQHPETVA